jgi:CBS domain containing-hemolysin-like protein
MIAEILIAVAMLGGNAFFVGAEFGLVSSRRSSIELHAVEGSRAAKITLGAMERVSLMLAGAQLGVTLCSLIFGAVAEPLFAHFLESPFHALGMPEQLLHPVSLVIALILLTYVHVVLGEMVPKNIALAGPAKAALWLTPPLVLFVKVTMPIVTLLNAIANGATRLLGVKPRRELASSFNRDEVAGFVKESHREGLLSEDEEHLLSGALSFDEKDIAAVLLPIKKLVTVPETTTAQQVEELAGKTGYSRFPVTGTDNQLVGYIHLKDLLEISATEQNNTVSLSVIRELPTLQLETSLRKALVSMQHLGAHLAQVEDQDNNVIGVVALEDVLEELVGHISDDAKKPTGGGVR